MPGLLNLSQGGLLDQQIIQEAQRRSTLGLATGLLAAGGPSLMPRSFGQALATGLNQGQQSADQFIQRQLQNKFTELQLAGSFRQDSFRPLSKDEKVQRGLNPDQGFQINQRTGEIKAAGSAVQQDNKNGVNVILPNGTSTVSFDGGRTILAKRDAQGNAIFLPTPAGSKIGTLQGGANELGISTNRADDLIGERDLFVQARGQIGDLIKNIEGDPTSVGVGGSIRSNIKTAIGVGSDISGLLSGTSLSGVDLAARNEFNQALANGQIAQSDAERVNGLINNPNLSKLELLENNIGLILARSRVGEGRLPVDVIQRSINDVRLTGLTSTKQVLDRLREIDAQLNTRVKDLNTRIGGKTPNRFKIQDGRLVPIDG